MIIKKMKVHSKKITQKKYSVHNESMIFKRNQFVQDQVKNNNNNQQQQFVIFLTIFCLSLFSSFQ